MMTRLMLILLLPLAAAAQSLPADEAETLLMEATQFFDQANQAAETNLENARALYDKAILRFERLRSEGGIANGRLFYNLANAYWPAAPLCGPLDVCVGYLRVRSRDLLGNESAAWTTAFVLRYDGAAPAADFTFVEGITTTQTLVHLAINADDQGSGVRELRLSGDGRAWTPWEAYVTERAWILPATTGEAWPVYLQVRDGAGLTSEALGAQWAISIFALLAGGASVAYIAATRHLVRSLD